MKSQEQLRIETTYTENSAEMRFIGRLNAVSAEYAEKALLIQLESLDAMPKVRLDLAELTYLASAGLRTFILAQKTAKANGREFTLVNVPKNIFEVMRITGLTNILIIEK